MADDEYDPDALDVKEEEDEDGVSQREFCCICCACCIAVAAVQSAATAQQMNQTPMHATLT
jgi:hypothetical protein